MSLTLRAACLLLTAALMALCAAERTQTIELDWCSVVLPKSVKVGEPSVYRVTLKKIPENAAKINFDLHWIDESGATKGMNTYGGSKLAEVNQPLEWTLTPAAKDQLAKVLPVIYLSREGTWATKTADKPPKLPAIDVVR